MKYIVHRVRFVEYVPQAIHCMAFEDSSEPSRLALSRADSSIEIWNFSENWYQETVIPGCDGTSVESLDWCRGRLFTGGLHANITEWDLISLHPKVTVDSFGGAVWCLSVNHARTHMAVGCEDGRVRLFEITADGLLYSKSLDQQEESCVSVGIRVITAWLQEHQTVQ
ncbi:U3 small nucleolar RNA-associated protein 4 [Desmophyllum pertusum]|uniref:U3 small nucleolar RNA-associated protein 4 n=1 Tax=Desmophyllum pertusum TaxID=174260 RepID=A0A9W9ZGR7_9CNID|nr:U3 small nucleolar RNA-associated protein 4 [Desmophyllum pertusum]